MKNPLNIFERAEQKNIPKLTITFTQKQIEINGDVYTLLKSDADILDDAFKIIEESKKIDPTDQNAVLKSLHDMASYVDTILGEGALKKISGGLPVGFLDLKNCMGAITTAVYEAYQTALVLKYDA